MTVSVSRGNRIAGFVNVPVIPTLKRVHDTSNESFPYKWRNRVANYTTDVSATDFGSRRELIGSRKPIDTCQLSERKMAGAVGVRYISFSGYALRRSVAIIRSLRNGILLNTIKMPCGLLRNQGDCIGDTVERLKSWTFAMGFSRESRNRKTNSFIVSKLDSV